MKEGKFQTFRYKPKVSLKENSWILEPVGYTTPWIHGYKDYPNNPVIVHVSAGQTLYIPALWYHAVNQIDDKINNFQGTIAINWWYDMDYNSFSCMVDLVKTLGILLEESSSKEEDEIKK